MIQPRPTKFADLAIGEMFHGTFHWNRLFVKTRPFFINGVPKNSISVMLAGFDHQWTPDIVLSYNIYRKTADESVRQSYGRLSRSVENGVI